MPFTEIICPGCMRRVAVDTEQRAAFCVYCGEKLPVRDGELPDADHAEDLEAKIYNILARLAKLYEDYHEDIFRYKNRKGAMSAIFGAWLGKSDSDHLHVEFYQSVTPLTAELAELLGTAKAEGEIFYQPATEKAVRLLLPETMEGFDNAESVTYSGLEKCAIPLLPFLADDELERQYAEYRPKSRKRLMGKDVLRAMKREREERGN